MGGLWLYTSQRDAGIAQVSREVKQANLARGDFAIELTTTFSSEADPFALQTGKQEAGGIELRLNGSKLHLPVEQPQRGETVHLTAVQGVVSGHNEIFVQASPPLAEAHLDHGLRLRLLADGSPIADHTFWSESGANIANSFSFTYQADSTGGFDDGSH